VTQLSSKEPNLIEPFDPEKHDRAAFSCGIRQIDNFFQQTANRQEKANNLRTYVMVTSHSEVIGFYATNAHAVDYQDLPSKYARNRPRHGSIPAAYISMIGVDEKHQGKGEGGVLLTDCLERLYNASLIVGISVVMLDVFDCGDSTLVQRRISLYQSYGFEQLPANELRMFIPMKTIEELFSRSEHM